MKKVVKTEEESLCPLNDLMNSNEAFGEHLTDDNMKNHKKQGFTLFVEINFLEKPRRGVERQADLLGLGTISLNYNCSRQLEPM